MHLSRLSPKGGSASWPAPAPASSTCGCAPTASTAWRRSSGRCWTKPSRRLFQRYADGVNAMIESGKDLPLEFSLAGVEPEPWTIEDSLAIAFYMSWNSSANLRHEVLDRRPRPPLGRPAPSCCAPLNWNPDLEARPGRPRPAAALAGAAADGGRCRGARCWPACSHQHAGWDPAGATALGSNNWAVGKSRSRRACRSSPTIPTSTPACCPGVGSRSA